MNKKILEQFLNKKILICLKTDYRYVGFIEALDDEMCTFRDKYDKLVIIRNEDISKLVEK